jgi:hypothetical protein
MPLQALDIEEPQVLARTGDEVWQHHVLLRRLRDAEWVTLTAGGAVQVIDLAEYSLVPLPRGGVATGEATDGVEAVGPDVVDKLALHHATAARLAGILAPDVKGVSPPAGTGMGWRVADTAAEEFGQAVPADVVTNSATGVTRGAIGLARWGVPERWLFVEMVPDLEVGAWERDKQCGAGRDRRLNGARDPVLGSTLVPLGESLSNVRPVDLQRVPDWPHHGPRASLELLRGVHSLGLTLLTYHGHWAKSSGVNADSAVAWEHRMLCQQLALAVGFDCLDPTNCASLELASRRIIMIERAARVNPKAPSFQGLSKMVEHAMDEGGGVATREFTAHMAQQAESEARILKQNRLLREELDAKKKQGSEKTPKGAGGAKGGD